MKRNWRNRLRQACLYLVLLVCLMLEVFPVYTVTCTSSEVTTALCDAELSCSQQKIADEKDEEENRRTVRSDRQRKEQREAEVFMKKVL